MIERNYTETCKRFVKDDVYYAFIKSSGKLIEVLRINLSNNSGFLFSKGYIATDQVSSVIAMKLKLKEDTPMSVIDRLGFEAANMYNSSYNDYDSRIDWIKNVSNEFTNIASKYIELSDKNISDFYVFDQSPDLSLIEENFKTKPIAIPDSDSLSTAKYHMFNGYM